MRNIEETRTTNVRGVMGRLPRSQAMKSAEAFRDEGSLTRTQVEHFLFTFFPFCLFGRNTYCTSMELKQENCAQ